jgi:hypothetical protein
VVAQAFEAEVEAEDEETLMRGAAAAGGEGDEVILVGASADRGQRVGGCTL